ncbi:S1C family serine protease [Aquisphaera insulae]|uniref:S1C family serine protease n=1 Tax=Aquisphaera insulae TaxID=2712864 RepID=UPI0013ECBAEF|nr:trypsin-like peptidase domain-containing protein [Aquisphaera insulae]
MASHLAWSAGAWASRRSLIFSCLLVAASPASLFAQGDAASLSASFRRAAERVLPSVVAVRSSVVEDPSGLQSPFGSQSIDMSATAPGYRRLIAPAGGGSGVVVDAGRGLILTTQQALGGGARAVVVFTDGRQMDAEQVTRDPRSDLALIRINPQAIRLKASEWGAAEPPQMGDWVVAVGRPQGRSHVISAGIVSGRGPVRSSPGESDALWTDALTGGTSAGGALVDLEGRVVGINVSPGAGGAVPDRFGLAITAEAARRFVAEVSESGQVRRGYLGLTIGSDAAGPVDQGIPPALVITAVTPGSPAETSGFLVGDRLVAVDGSPIVEVEALSRVVENAPVGRTFRLTITRGGGSQDVSVSSAARPDGTGVIASRPSASPRTMAPSRTLRAPVRQVPPGATGGAAGRRTRGSTISEDLPKELNPISEPSEGRAVLPDEPDGESTPIPKRPARGSTRVEPRPSAEPGPVELPRLSPSKPPSTTAAPELGAVPEPKPELRPTPPPESKPATKPDPTPPPKPEPKPAPKPEPTPPPKPEPKPAPKPEPTPPTKPEPKPAPKPEPAPTKPAPKPEPAPPPKTESKPKPDPKPDVKPVPAPDLNEISPLPPALEPAPAPAPSPHLEPAKGPS